MERLFACQIFARYLVAENCGLKIITIDNFTTNVLYIYSTGWFKSIQFACSTLVRYRLAPKLVESFNDDMKFIYFISDFI